MTETLYGWMRNLACYFIFLSAVMHFLPDNNYKKYIQFYMGLLLILLLLSPVLDFLHLENKIDAGVNRYVEEEERDREEWENYAREIEEEYGWNKKGENTGETEQQEEAAELLLDAKGFENVVVNLTNDSADVIVPQEYMADDKRAQIEDIVKRKTSVPVENIVITPMDDGSSDGE